MTLTTEMLPVFPYNDPAGLLGYAPAGLELSTQEYEVHDFKPDSYMASVGGYGIEEMTSTETKLAYLSEQLEFSEWLEMPGFEPEPEIHLRRAQEFLTELAERFDRFFPADPLREVVAPCIGGANKQIELARKIK